MRDTCYYQDSQWTMHSSWGPVFSHPYAPKFNRALESESENVKKKKAGEERKNLLTF